MPLLKNIRDSLESYRLTLDVDSTPYPGIDSNQLRLIEPILGHRDSLHFSVSTVQRSQAPPYTAVSSTWGDSAATKVIYLNGERFQVKPNLWSCLYQLVHGGKRILWVDAICINQTDNVEKSAQVRCMDQTYKNAACVAVWLGLSPSISDSPNQNAMASPPRTRRGDGLGVDELISQLVNRPYWSRVWVIQEFLLGTEAEIWYGENHMDMPLFQDMVLEHAGVNLYVIQHLDYTTSNIPHRAWSLVTSRTLDKHPNFGRPLWRLLVDHRYSMCKDPRDKVFALLGLVPEEERNLLSRFFPNYDISEDHVVIITLVHLQEYSRVTDDCPEIRLTSDDIFLGLGVNDKSRRRRLLRRTADVSFDYYDDLAGNPLETD